jgi:hypothetical protein
MMTFTTFAPFMIGNLRAIYINRRRLVNTKIMMMMMMMISNATTFKATFMTRIRITMLDMVMMMMIKMIRLKLMIFMAV